MFKVFVFRGLPSTSVFASAIVIPVVLPRGTPTRALASARSVVFTAENAPRGTAEQGGRKL